MSNIRIVAASAVLGLALAVGFLLGNAGRDVEVFIVEAPTTSVAP